MGTHSWLWWLRHLIRMLRRIFFPRRGDGIVLLVPFRTDYGTREQNWRWLEKYWRFHLPGAELVIGTDDHLPFCKTAAVNSAARRAHGDIFVILDADCYIDSETVLDCAEQIRCSRREGYPLWFIPYRRFYRLTRSATYVVLNSSPYDPYVFTDPPPHRDLETPDKAHYGHGYGALIQIMPREAFVAAGGMDERFRGWGGEDVAFMHAVDAMYGRHHARNGPVFHLWHEHHKGRWAGTRQWEGQPGPEMNERLSAKYERAAGQRAKMAKLVEDAQRHGS